MAYGTGETGCNWNLFGSSGLLRGFGEEEEEQLILLRWESTFRQVLWTIPGMWHKPEGGEKPT